MTTHLRALFEQACQDLWRPGIQVDRLRSSAVDAICGELARQLAGCSHIWPTRGPLPEGLSREVAALDRSADPADTLEECFERLLALELQSAGEDGMTLQKVPRVRKARGAFYTPSELVDRVVRLTLAPIADELEEDCEPGDFGPRLLQLKILDPAAGSGRFLRGALRYLWQRLEAHPNPGPPPPGKGDEAGRWRRALVRQCLYGVDSSELALRVARTALAFDAGWEQLGPDQLAERLIVGDSLVGVASGELEEPTEESATAVIATRREAAREAIREARVRSSPAVEAPPVHWPLAFPEVFPAGFDAIVGNPPYRSLDRLPAPYSRYLQQCWPEVWMGQADLYFFFMVRALELCRRSGRVGLVTSRYYLESRFARGLRRKLLELGRPDHLIDFRNEAVFPGVGVDAAVTVLVRGEAAERFEVERPGEAMFRADPEDLQPKAWVLLNRRRKTLRQQIDADHPRLGELCLVGKGIETGANRIFEVDPEQAEELDLGPSHRQRMVRNSEIGCFTVSWQDRYWIYLEDTPEEELDEQLPAVRLRLHAHRERLENRIAFRRGQCRWYRFSYPRHLHRYPLPKLLCPYLATTNRFAIDPDGRYLSSTDSLILSPHDGQPEWLLYYLAGLLNSSVLNVRYRMVAKLKSGGLLSYAKRPMEDLPIPWPPEAHPGCREIARRAEEIYRRRLVGEETAHLERRLDAAVEALYGVELPATEPQPVG